MGLPKQPIPISLKRHIDWLAVVLALLAALGIRLFALHIGW